MSIILKPLFEILTGDITICDNILCNYLFLLIIGELSYCVAYRSVGNLYNSGAITGRSVGSIIHWVIRIPFFILAAYILRFFIWLYTFVTSVPPQVWWALLAILLICIILFIVLRITQKRSPEEN